MGLDLTEQFTELIDNFITAETTLDLSTDVVNFEESSGFSFTQLKRTINKYNNAKLNIENLYAATSNYLEKVKNNIEECENLNSMQPSDEEEN